ncbi:MNIO family bufferin maturase [Zooshikella sp. RANM57]|uniref:MNIO family bufferin maturase n=1 Tax=Zooshikella sp. RANM57 TaxID=3425863 RepID=UPI003D6DBCDC
MKKVFHGFGLGLRKDYYSEILATQPAVDWFEIISENYFVDGGKPLYFLEAIREQYPIAMHGVSLSIGSTDPLNTHYLKNLKSLADRINPIFISDHLCWTSVGGINSHDLLPLPYTEASIKHIVERINAVQDYLGRQILLENLSSYIMFAESDMTEWDFVSEITERADCLLLLDINNIYVSARNHQFDPIDYLKGVPAGRVMQHHLAGHSDYGEYIIDTHDAPVVDPVWQLYKVAAELFGPVSTMIERDDNMPPFSELLAELNYARTLAEPTYTQQQTSVVLPTTSRFHFANPAKTMSVQEQHYG